MCGHLCVCASFHILFQTLRLALVPVNTYQLCQTVCAIDQVLFVPPSYNQQLQLCAQCLPGHYFIKYCAVWLKIFLEILKQRYILCPKVWDEEKWMVCEMLSARLWVRANLLWHLMKWLHRCRAFLPSISPRLSGVDVMKHTQDEYNRGRWTARRNECEPQQSLVSTSDVCTYLHALLYLYTVAYPCKVNAYIILFSQSREACHKRERVRRGWR